jgi:hypothetical protein
MYVVNATIGEREHEGSKAMALECGQPTTAVLRVALTLGLQRMESELNKHRAGEDSKWEIIERLIGTDGRRTAKRG